MQQCEKEDRQNLPPIVFLLEERLLGYKALAQSFEGCREAYISCNLSGIEQAIGTQSSCCSRIATVETAIRKYAAQNFAPESPLFSGLDQAEVQRAQNVISETASLRMTIARLNRIYGRMVAKAAYNTAILTNLYANALIYGDPRAVVRGPRGWLEE